MLNLFEMVHIIRVFQTNTQSTVTFLHSVTSLFLKIFHSELMLI